MQLFSTLETNFFIVKLLKLDRPAAVEYHIIVGAIRNNHSTDVVSAKASLPPITWLCFGN